MSRILVVDDEVDIQHVLEYNLRSSGHEVALAGRADEAIRVAAQFAPDLVLLDLMLPDLPGFEVCKLMRQDPRLRDVPVIILTAKNDEIDRVVGFEVGADDYVSKPFSVRELLLRIGAILRRGRGDSTGAGPIEFGVLRIDVGARRVWVEGQELTLTPIELQLLVTLYQRRDRVQSRADLLADVWQVRSDVTSRTVNTHVKRLREKLGPAKDYIETVRGAGYRFAARP